MLRSTATLAPPKTGRLGFAILIGLLALAAAAKVIVADTLDPDCFWHLRVGEAISSQSWPHALVDNLSFASIKKPWTPYSWLAELWMKKLWDVGGYRAAVAVQAGMEAAFLFLLAMSAVEASVKITGWPRYLASIFATVAGGILSLAYLSFRPVTFALVLLAGIAWLLWRDRRMEQKSKAVWLVPILTALLANVHFYSLLVPLWTGALLVGDAIQTHRFRRGILLTCSTLVASTMTPLLPGTLRTVLDYSLNDVLVHSPVIAEMAPFYRGAMGHLSAVIVGMILVCVVLRCLKGDRPGIGEMVWLGGCTVLLFMVGRMAPVFAIAGVPMFAATMPNFSDRLLTKPALITATAFLFLFGCWKLGGAFPAENEPISKWLNRHGPGFAAYPCGAADYVDQNVPAVSGRIICEFTWGGYLEWRLGNRFQMLMDGRTQLFAREFWRSLFFGSEQDRQRIVGESRADAAIVPLTHSMFRQSLGDLHWRSVYRDEFAEVFLPPGK